MRQRKEPTWKQLAELYGVVVTPEEAQRHYRRLGWRGIILIWSAAVSFLVLMLVLKLALGDR